MMFAMTMFITIIFINVIVLPRYSNGFALRRYFFLRLCYLKLQFAKVWYLERDRSALLFFVPSTEFKIQEYNYNCYAYAWALSIYAYENWKIVFK